MRRDFRIVSCGISTDDKPDHSTTPIALKACTRLQALEYGKVIHGFVKNYRRIGMNMFVGSVLIEFYSKCGQMGEALRVFKEFSGPDVIMWTLMAGHEQNGCPEEAVALFSQIEMAEHVNPDLVMLVSVVSACAQLRNCKLGSCVHGFMIRRGFDIDLS